MLGKDIIPISRIQDTYNALSNNLKLYTAIKGSTFSKIQVDPTFADPRVAVGSCIDILK